jgi:hypothetical protein
MNNQQEKMELPEEIINHEEIVFYSLETFDSNWLKVMETIYDRFRYEKRSVSSKQIEIELFDIQYGSICKMILRRFSDVETLIQFTKPNLPTKSELYDFLGTFTDPVGIESVDENGISRFMYAPDSFNEIMRILELPKKELIRLEYLLRPFDEPETVTSDKYYYHQILDDFYSKSIQIIRYAFQEKMIEFILSRLPSVIKRTDKKTVATLGMDDLEKIDLPKTKRDRRKAIPLDAREKLVEEYQRTKHNWGNADEFLRNKGADISGSTFRRYIADHKKHHPV